MNRSIRRVAMVIGLAFLALFVNLNIVQLAKSDDLANHPRNRRLLVEEYQIRRGEILAGDVVLAESVASGNPRYANMRRYPEHNLYGHLTGYYSFYFGASGLEATFNDELLGKEPATPSNFVDELLGRETTGNVLQLSIVPELQRIAAKALGKQRGAVAAIDPATGGVLALYAWPTFDPNPLSQDPANETRIRNAWNALQRNPARPLTFKATQGRYPAGSTFKIITAAAGLENGMTPATTFPDPSTLDLPDTNLRLRNFQGGPCVGGRISIATGFRVSCNTTFAQVAMRVGPVKLAATAAKFGLEETLPFQIPTVAACVKAIAGAGCDDPATVTRPGTAYSGIGQQDVRVTPLQMAVVAATVANGGFMRTPYLVQKILSPEGETLFDATPEDTGRIYKKKTADAMRKLMIDAVRFGTGAVVGFRDASKGIVGGKTGTAQTGIEGESPHVWFVAFAPRIAVAVVVENGGDLGDAATGGRVAGPIAKALIDFYTRKGPS